jgi:hypothetical protein
MEARDLAPKLGPSANRWNRKDFDATQCRQRRVDLDELGNLMPCANRSADGAAGRYDPEAALSVRARDLRARVCTWGRACGHAAG